MDTKLEITLTSDDLREFLIVYLKSKGLDLPLDAFTKCTTQAKIFDAYGNSEYKKASGLCFSGIDLPLKSKAVAEFINQNRKTDSKTDGPQLDLS